MNLATFSAPTDPCIPALVYEFHRATLDTVRRYGRLYELGMIARLKLRTGEYTKDVDVGMDLVRKGKIRFFASSVRDRKQLASMFERLDEHLDYHRTASEVRQAKGGELLQWFDAP